MARPERPSPPASPMAVTASAGGKLGASTRAGSAGGVEQVVGIALLQPFQGEGPTRDHYPRSHCIHACGPIRTVIYRKPLFRRLGNCNIQPSELCEVTLEVRATHDPEKSLTVIATVSTMMRVNLYGSVRSACYSDPQLAHRRAFETVHINPMRGASLEKSHKFPFRGVHAAIASQIRKRSATCTYLACCSSDDRDLSFDDIRRLTRLKVWVIYISGSDSPSLRRLNVIGLRRNQPVTANAMKGEVIREQRGTDPDAHLCQRLACGSEVDQQHLFVARRVL